MRIALRGVVGLALLASALTASGVSAACRPRADLLARVDRVIQAVDAHGCGREVVVAREAFDPTDTSLSDALVSDASWLPGGQAFVYGMTHSPGFVYDRTELRRASVRGGPSTMLLQLPLAGSITEVAASPDGRRIAFALFNPNYPVLYATWGLGVGSPQRIYVVNVDGSGLQPVLSATGTSDAGLVWSPDSKHLAFGSSASGGVTSMVYVADLQTGPGLLGRRVSPLEVSARAPAWAPDGKHLAFEGVQQSDVLGYDPQTWVVSASGAGAHVVGPGSSPAYAPGGRRLAASTSFGLVVLDLTRRSSRLVTHEATDFWPAWSPDGREIAFTRWGSTVNRQAGVWTVRPDGRDATWLTREDYAGRPSWRR